MATLLTACSDQKFAFRKKLKADRQETAFAGKKARVHTPVEAITSQEAAAEDEQPRALSSETARTSPAPEAAVAAPVLAASPKSISPDAPVTVNRDLSAKQLRKATQLSRKLDKELDSAAGAVDVRKMIVIGLVLILIGFVVGLVFGGLGWLISFVGVIFLLVGLIVYLMNNL